MVQPLWKFTGSSRSQIQNYQSDSTPGYMPPKNWKQTFEQTLVHKCSEQHSWQSSKGGNSSHTHQQKNINEIRCGLTVKQYWATRRSEALTHVRTQVNLENMVSRRSQTQKATCYLIPFIWNVQERHILGDRKEFVVARDWGEGEIGRGDCFMSASSLLGWWKCLGTK